MNNRQAMSSQTITHKLYLDDSGTKEYAPSIDDYGEGNTRHFVFGGLLASLPTVELLIHSVRNLKREIFGTDAVEIKSNWLRIPKEREEKYLIPYGLTDRELEGFVDELYDLVINTDIILFSAVVDKVHMKEQYSESAHYAPAVAYECLLQRVELASAHNDFHVHVTIDDISGKTPKKNNYKDLLKRQHQMLLQYGSKLIKDFPFNHIAERLTFKSSDQSHLVQVADLVAYNVFRQFTDHWEEWEGSQARLEVYGYVELMSERFYQTEGGRIQGYGIVKFPLLRRRRWSWKK